MANDFLSYLQQNAAQSNSVRKAYVPGMKAGKATGRGTGVPDFNPASIPSSSQPSGPDAPYSTGLSGILSDTMGAVASIPFVGDATTNVLDWMQRASYGSNNMFQKGAQDVRAGMGNEKEMGFLDLLKTVQSGITEGAQFGQGFSGDQKVLGSDVLKPVYGAEGAASRPGWQKGLEGFMVDVLADPTTYAGVGAIGKLGKLLGVGGKTVETAAEVATLEAKATTALGEAASKEIKNVPEYSGPGRALSPQEINPALKPRTNLQKAAEISKAKYAPAKVTKVPAIKLAELPTVARKALTTADVAGAGFKFIPPAPEVIKQAAGYKLPPPVGKTLKGTPEESLVTPRSTTNFARPSAEASNRAEAIISNAQDFLSTAKNTAKASKDYLSGFVRPTLDTPAETEFLKQMGIGPEVQFFKLPRQERFRLTQPYSADAQITKPPNTVKVKIAGEKVPTEISSNTLWDFLHGKSVTIGDRLVTPGEVLLKGKGAKSGYRMTADSVVKKNQAALDNPKFWEQAKANAQKIAHPDNAAGVAHNVARQQREYVRQTNNIVYNDLKDWKELVGKTYPAISSEGLDAAYAVVQDAMKAQWAKVKSGTLSQEEFMITTNTSSRLQDMMNRAINENANPEKIIADTAEVMAESQTETLRLTTEAMSLITDLKAKTAVAEDLSRQVAEAQATVEAAQAVEKAAPAKRMVDAQMKPGDVTDEVRQAATTNGLSPSAQATIDAGDFASSSTLGVDKAIGLVKSNTAETLTAIKKHGFGYNTPKQTNNINRLVNATSPLARKSPKTVARIANIIRATERNLEELGGHMPTAWNFKKGAERRNVGFSSAKLLEDMLAIDSTVGLKALFGGGDTQWWNKVVTAAAFKDKKALDAITDPDLKKFLKAYDPRHNTEVVDSVGVGKVNANVEAQAASAANNAAVSATTSSPARAAMDAANAPKVADKAIQRTPGTPADARPLIDGAAGNAADKMNETLNGSKTPVEVVVQASKNSLYHATVGDRPLSVANNASRSVLKSAGAKSAKAGERITNRAFDAPITQKLAGAFRTNYKAVTARPFMQTSFDYVAEVMGHAAGEWQKIRSDLGKLPPEEALNVIKKLNPDNAGIQVSEEGNRLVEKMRQDMEASFSGSGLDKHIAGNSSAGISALTQKNMNEWLVSNRVLGPDGKVFQMGEGTTGAEWLKGWETTAGQFKTAKDATHFMHNLEQSMFNAVAERNFYDSMAVTFGGKGLKTVDGVPYLEGIGFPDELAPQINQVNSLVMALKNPKQAAKILREFDQVQRLWKTGVTIYNPSHHIRNAVGDTWLLMADGGKVSHVTRAAKLMNKFKEAKLNLPQDAAYTRGMSLTDAKDLPKLMNKIMNPSIGDVIVKNKRSGMTFDGEQVMAIAHAGGLFQNANVIEDIVASSSSAVTRGINKVQSAVGRPEGLFGGKVHNAVVEGAEIREQTIRLGHLIHALESSPIKRIKGMSDEAYKKKLFQEAVQRVKKNHPDGMDLTEFERSTMRRIIPFYSWQRKSIPLILQAAARRPGMLTAYPKMQQEASVAMGQDPGSNALSPYLPGDSLFPNWMLNMGLAVSGKSMGEQGMGYDVWKGPSVPSSDLFGMGSGDAKGLLSPALKIPMELMTGTQVDTGAPVSGTNQNVGEYLVNQIPGSSMPGINELVSHIGGTSSKTSTAEDFLNWLTAAGHQNSGDYQKQAQFDTLDRLKAG